MKAPSPLVGFNNNFRHKGAVYHIQTEDSGIKHPHIITHLFADGGRILKSVKTSYAALVSEPNYADIVRALMKDQHKAMIVALRDGQFDPGGAREVKLPEMGAFLKPQANEGRADASQAIAMPETPPSAPPPARTSVSPAALEKAAVARASKGPPDGRLRLTSDFPPPPPTLSSDREAPRPASMRPPSMRPPAARSRPPAGGATPSQRPSLPPGTKYAATRPASIFAASKPSSGSVFGEDLISERSLDEVILSYLAEDLEGDKR